jgi:uncharacterized membrane protein YphA (DoxX/SURF4 family)
LSFDENSLIKRKKSLLKIVMYSLNSGGEMAKREGNKIQKNDYSHQAYRILQFAFVIAPIIAGVDKFLNLLVRWESYLSPAIHKTLQGRGSLFMMVVGVIEIIAGLGVAFKPKVFAYIVSLWLLCIIINLLLTNRYYDVALRDLGLMLAALALGRLSHKYD